MLIISKLYEILCFGTVIKKKKRDHIKALHKRFVKNSNKTRIFFSFSFFFFTPYRLSLVSMERVTDESLLQSGNCTIPSDGNKKIRPDSEWVTGQNKSGLQLYYKGGTASVEKVQESKRSKLYLEIKEKKKTYDNYRYRTILDYKSGLNVQNKKRKREIDR